MEAFPRPRPFEQPRPSRCRGSGSAASTRLLVAGIGLIAFSIYTLGVATEEDVPGDLYYAVRRVDLRRIRIALMLAVARVDYSRALPGCASGIYAVVASISVFVFAEAARQDTRLDRARFCTFRPSSSARSS